MATTVPAPSSVTSYPLRTPPQTAFDSAVKTAISQNVTFIQQMNEQVIPALNTIGAEADEASGSYASSKEAGSEYVTRSEQASQTAANCASATDEYFVQSEEYVEVSEGYSSLAMGYEDSALANRNAAEESLARCQNAAASIVGRVRLHDESLDVHPGHPLATLLRKTGGVLTGGIAGPALIVGNDGVIAPVLANVFVLTPSADMELAISPLPAGTSGRFSLILNNASSHVITWPLSVTWVSEPELTEQGSAVFEFITSDGGQSWLGIQML